MASRIISLFRILSRSGGQVTSSAPNSWATVGTWRRFFEMKEQEEEERVDAVEEIMEGIIGMNGARPIAAEQAVEARKEFVKEHYRNMTSVEGSGRTEGAARRGEERNDARVSQETASVMREVEDQQLNRPNLAVPVGESYMTLAQ
mmetsp:Transcript_15589/g.18498  ORF Transcript_15589/g.18498 Transcript_15589/m.18498 type:complete len:146 (-) Transcript_15589:441-878(-)|eukprot:CAMPEP_0198264386 /NCGR_PEP_ID=MMETSP1447-20131203/15566_1 /TAXON_ID=420782 /ORGANISM="Chaetoceros dichaeta, Strain CCMP1751" /LENGTH=145 /DNA_ID=CAMNT_0043953299 /DNA_START=114 /DNA_END=551 /DNA_ORIENTATION=+